ncbi:MAG: hypothetical protein AAFX46_08180 [Cyanobacteria bacterium J06636_27]
MTHSIIAAMRSPTSNTKLQLQNTNELTLEIPAPIGKLRPKQTVLGEVYVTNGATLRYRYFQPVYSRC